MYRMCALDEKWIIEVLQVAKCSIKLSFVLISTKQNIFQYIVEIGQKKSQKICPWKTKMWQIDLSKKHLVVIFA